MSTSIPSASPVDAISTIDSAFAKSFASDGTSCMREKEHIEEIADDLVRTLIANPTLQLPALIELVRSRRASLVVGSDITTEVVGICKQVLAFGAAGFGLSIGFADRIVTLPSAIQKGLTIGGITYLELTLVSLVVLALYLLQARYRYPFLSLRKIGNAWPYFYYASVSAGIPRNPVETRRRQAQSAMLYARDFVHFVQKVTSETEEERLRAEVQQYFLLLAYQGYVNQFSLRLTNTFFYGVCGSLVTAVVLTIWGVIK